MKDKLCISERRTRIIEFLLHTKYATRVELAEMFGVSIDTIHRDIVYLSSNKYIYSLYE